MMLSEVTARNANRGFEQRYSSVSWLLADPICLMLRHMHTQRQSSNSACMHNCVPRTVPLATSQ
jgi:hypothetical protein